MTEPQRRIVVGVDTSAASRQALAWALDEAKMRGDDIVVVHAWQLPDITSYGGAALPLVAHEDVEKEADRMVRGLVDDMVPDTLALRVTTKIVPGHPAKVLVAESSDADLLVVGSRGHGGFPGLLLGSVSGHVVRHAACPVVVVRESS